MSPSPHSNTATALCLLSHQAFICPFRPHIQPSASVHGIVSLNRTPSRVLLCWGSSAPCLDALSAPTPITTPSPVKRLLSQQARFKFIVLLEACTSIFIHALLLVGFSSASNSMSCIQYVLKRKFTE